MSIFIVDVEADGPIPHLYSMVSFAAVKLEPDLKTNFKAELKPISDNYVQEALNVIGYTREQTMKFPEAEIAMNNFYKYVMENAEDWPIFMSDNNGFDWQFINYYFHRFLGKNPFGYSSRRIGDLYSGFLNDFDGGNRKFRQLVKTVHNHDPLNDAIGHAEAILEMINQGLKIKI